MLMALNPVSFGDNLHTFLLLQGLCAKIQSRLYQHVSCMPSSASDYYMQSGLHTTSASNNIVLILFDTQPQT